MPALAEKRLLAVAIALVTYWLKKNRVWYYQLNLVRNLGKTNSLNELDLEEFVILSKSQSESENSWCVDGACQGSCRLIYAAKGTISFCAICALITQSFSGLRVTGPTTDQSRVFPDHLAG